MPDGSIRIETRIDNSKAKKDLKELNDISNSSANKVNKDMTTSIDKLNANWQKLEAQQEKNNQKIEEYKTKLDELNGINISNPTTEAEFSFNNKVNTEITDLNIKLKESEATTNLIDSKFSQIGLQAQKITNEIKESNGQTKSFSKNMSDVSSNLGDGILKIGKFALAMIGIRTAWQSIKSLGSLWLNSDSEQSKQTKADLDYIKGTLAYSIAPLVQFIVKLFGSLMQVINSITQALFGFSVFSKASSDYLKNASKSAKEIKKSLAGFDEANVLSSNKDSSGKSGSGDMTPSFDLTKTNEFFDNLLKKAQETYEELERFYSWDNLLNLDLSWAGDWELAVFGVLTILKGVWDILTGIFDFLIGIGDIIVGIFTSDFKLIEIGFQRIIDGIVGILTGLIEIIIGKLEFVIGFLHGFFATVWQGVKDWASAIGKSISDFISDVWDKIKSLFSGIGKWFGDRFNEAYTSIKNAFGNVKGFFTDKLNDIKGVFGGIANWFKDIFTKAWTNVKNVFSTGGKIFDGIKEGIADTFKTVVNKLIEGMNKIIATPFNAINGMLNKIRNTSFLGISPFKGLWSENPLTVPQIPKLALGGVVARPTQAIIGEAGPERVIPLSEDAEWINKVVTRFAELSNSNGGVIQLVVDGRVLAEVVNDVNNKQQFATNGGIR